MTENKPDLTRILAAVAAYYGRTHVDERGVTESLDGETAIQDILVDLENLAAATGARFDTYASHVHYLAEQGLCMGCGYNPDTAKAEGEDWSWGTCSGSHELEGFCLHEFDDISDASAHWIKVGADSGYSVKMTGGGIFHPEGGKAASQNYRERVKGAWE